MKLKKKYAIFSSIIAIVVLINAASTMRLLFSVMHPERQLKEAVTEYFKNNLNKAVKFENIYIDYDGDIIINDFNVSTTSDFNDNVSLVRSKHAIIHLNFFKLFMGSMVIKGLDLINSEITLQKKYEKSHLECLNHIINPERFIKRIRQKYGEFYVHIHRARLFYRETLKEKQVAIEMEKLNCEIYINKNSIMYSISGKIKPCRSTVDRWGDILCEGTFDLLPGSSYSHQVRIDNFDLTYLNEYIREYKLAEIEISGGWSTNLKINRFGNVFSVRGKAETNNICILYINKKYNLLSNENMDIDLDVSYDYNKNCYTVNTLKVSDDIFSLQSSGDYAQNEKEDLLRLRFKTNKLDLSDLSQNLTPYKDIEYAGSLEASGEMILDFKNKKSSGSKINMVLDEFTLSQNKKGTAVKLIDESSARLKLTDTALDVDVVMQPLQSDLSVKSRTSIAGWFPFKSDTQIDFFSKKMNVDNLRLTIQYLINTMYAAAYNDKKSAIEVMPFLQRPIGRFMNNNNIALKINFTSVQFGKKASWNNFILGAQLNKGSISTGDFTLNGFDASYKFRFQGYFNTDQPYVKLEGGIDDFNCNDFFSRSGLKGDLSGKARFAFEYQLSAARLADMLDNGKGNVNLYVGKGEMKNTKLQQDIIKFLAKNGYVSESLGIIQFDDITLSISQIGENFWFSNFGMKGDTLFFNARGDYTYEAGLNSGFAIMVRNNSATMTIPLMLTGQMLTPCLDIYNKKDSRKLCF